MVTFHPAQNGLGSMGFAPVSRCKFVAFSIGWVGVDGAQYFVQPKTLFHRQRKLSQHLCCEVPDDSNAQYFIFAGYS